MHPVLNLAARSGLEGSTAGKKDGTLTARLIIVRLYERIFFFLLRSRFGSSVCTSVMSGVAPAQKTRVGMERGGMHAPAGAVLSICGENYRATWCGGAGGNKDMCRC